MAELKEIGKEIRESTTNSSEELSGPYTGITFVSPLGKKFFVTVSDDGVLISTEVIK